MTIKVFCPLCGKRIMDVINNASGEVSTKCRHCNKVVQIIFDEIMHKSNKNSNS